MSNVELARFLAGCMYQLACMVVWYQRGNTARAEKCESDFRKTVSDLNMLERNSGEVEE